MIDKMLEKITLLFDRPVLVLIAALFITIFLGAAIPKLQLDNDLINFLPEKMPARVNYHRFQDTFGSNELVFIAFYDETGIYQPRLLKYIDDLGNRIRELNKTFPLKNVSEIMGTENDESALILSSIDEFLLGMSGASHEEKIQALKTLFNDKQKLQDELLWEEKTAEKIAYASKTVDFENLFKASVIPINDIDHILNTDYITGSGEKFTVEKLFTIKDAKGNKIERPELNQKNLKVLKKHVNSWDLYNGMLVSYDKGKAEKHRAGEITSIELDRTFTDNPEITPLMITLNNNIGVTNRQKINKIIFNMIEKDLGLQTIVHTKDDQTGEKKWDLVKDNTSKALVPGLSHVKYYISGEPVIYDQISQLMTKDLLFLFPFVVIIIILMLFFSFRNFPGVFYPMISVLLSTIWVMGLMSLCNVPINIVTTSLPVILIATGSAYGIHLMNSYFTSPDTDRLKIMKESVRGVGAAILMAGLTTVAGFGSNVTSRLVNIKNFGIFAACGVFFAIIITLIVIPSMAVLRKKPRKEYHINEEEGKRDWLSKMLRGMSSFVLKNYRLTAFSALVLIALMMFGLSNIKVEFNELDFFQSRASIKISDHMLNQKLAGTQTLSIVFETKKENGVLNTELLSIIDELSYEVRKNFSFVTKTVSMNNYLKKMNQEMYGGKTEKYVLPDSEQKVNDYLLLYSGDLSDFININSGKNNLRLLFTMERTTCNNIEKVENYCISFLEKHKKRLETLNVKYTFSNPAHLALVANDLIVKGQIVSILTSAFVVAILLYIIIRHLGMTLMALIPITTGLIVNFGIMGLGGIELNAATSLVSAVTIGVGIDYAIHYTTRFQKEFRLTGSMDEAIKNTSSTSGRAIFYNMASVTLGFLVLMFSEFIPLNDFSLLISVCMVATGFGSLILIPMALKLFMKNMKPGS